VPSTARTSIVGRGVKGLSIAACAQVTSRRDSERHCTAKKWIALTVCRLLCLYLSGIRQSRLVS
jgi:hypothetical protein